MYIKLRPLSITAFREPYGQEKIHKKKGKKPFNTYKKIDIGDWILTKKIENGIVKPEKRFSRGGTGGKKLCD